MNSLSRTLDETFPLKTVLIATLSPSRRNSSSRTSGTFCRLPGDQRLRRSPWTMCMRSCWTSNAWRTETLLCRSVCFAFSDARRSTSSETKRRLSRRLCRLVAARVAVASMVSGELSFTDYGEFFIWILILIKGIFETFQSLSNIEIQNLFEKSFKKNLFWKQCVFTILKVLFMNGKLPSVTAVTVVRTSQSSEIRNNDAKVALSLNNYWAIFSYTGNPMATR